MPRLAASLAFMAVLLALLMAAWQAGELYQGGSVAPPWYNSKICYCTAGWATDPPWYSCPGLAGELYVPGWLPA